MNNVNQINVIMVTVFKEILFFGTHVYIMNNVIQIIAIMIIVKVELNYLVKFV